MSSENKEIPDEDIQEEEKQEQQEEQEQDDAQREQSYNDKEDYQARRKYEIGNRPTPLSNNLLHMIGDLLQPQTMGFDHINMDMTFTFLDRFDIDEARNSSFIITACDLLGLKKSAYNERSSLATLLNLKRSQNGQSMNLFNKTVTESKQELEDKTIKKTRFSGFFNKKKGDE